MSEHAPGYAPNEAGSPPAPTVDVRALRALAEAATPGPWYPMLCQVFSVRDGKWKRYYAGRALATVHSQISTGGGPLHSPERNAAFIAAFNPAVALALLDRIEALEKALEFAEVGRDAFQEMWQHGRGAVRLMEEQSERDCAARDQAMIAAGELATSLSQARAALGREEASDV